MKSKKFLTLFIFVSFICSSAFVQGSTDYAWEVEEDKLFIYEIRSFDEDLADDVYVNSDIEDLLGAGAEVGYMKANMITDVDEIADYNNDGTEDDPGWEIDGWFWSEEWTDQEDDFEDPEDSEIFKFSGWKISQDPEVYSMLPGWEVLFFVLIRYTGVPSPADQWLDDIEWADIEVEGSTLSIEQNAATTSNLDEDIILYYEFQSNGLFKGYRVETTDGDIVYEVSLQSFLSNIPGYGIPLLTGIMLISIIGVIYSFNKKK